MRRDEGTRVWLGHLAALGLALLGVVLLAQVLAGALGDLVVNALSALIA